MSIQDAIDAVVGVVNGVSITSPSPATLTVASTAPDGEVAAASLPYAFAMAPAVTHGRVPMMRETVLDVPVRVFLGTADGGVGQIQALYFAWVEALGAAFDNALTLGLPLTIGQDQRFAPFGGFVGEERLYQGFDVIVSVRYFEEKNLGA